MTAPHDFNRSILHALRGVAGRVRRHLIVQGLASVLWLVVLLAAMQFAADYMLVLERFPRAVLLIVLASVILARLRRRFVIPVLTPLGPQRIASTLERHLPELHDRLISAVQFATDSGRPAGAAAPDESAAMREHVVRDVINDVARIRGAQLVHNGRTANAALLIVACVGVAWGMAVGQPRLLGVWIERDLLLRDVAWPIRYEIVLARDEAAGMLHPRGDDFSLSAIVRSGGMPHNLTMEFETGVAARGLRPMSRVGDDTFRCDFGPLTESMRVRFRAPRWGADETTRWYDIGVADRPRVRRAVVTITPPKYTGLEAYQLPEGQLGGDIPEGAAVRIAIRTNKPVASATLRSGDAVISDAVEQDAQNWEAVARPQRSAGYRFALTDELGWEDLNPMTFSIRLVPDRAPTVRLTLPGVGGMVLAGAELPIVASFEDNWGLADAQFITQIDRVNAAASATPTETTIAGFQSNQKTLSHRWTLPLAPLGLQPQDHILLSASGRDFKDFDEPNIGRSTIHNLRVVTREELETELTRRELEWRQEFEQIILAQEGIRARLTELLAEDAPAGREVRFAREERAQRQIASRTRKVHDQFRQIMDEIEINRIADARIRGRLIGGVIEPLDRLAIELIPAAADGIERALVQSSEEATPPIAAGQSAVLSTMNEVLANMLKWEGYNEAAALLREIMKQQGEINRQTEAELQRQIESLFGPQPDAD